MQFSLKERRLCRMEAPVERLRDPSRFPELEGRAKEAPTTVRDIQGSLADRRERYIGQLKEKSADTLRTELGQLTTRAATLYRDHMEALLELRAKDKQPGVTGTASAVTRAKADFLILLVQDHCRALYEKTKKMDPAITAAVQTLAPLGIALYASDDRGKFRISEMGQSSEILFIQYQRVQDLIKTRKDIVAQRALVAAAKEGKDKEEKEYDLKRLVYREESLVDNLRRDNISTDDASLPQAAKDTLLAARYLDAFGGKREAPAPPVRPPPKVEKAPDKRQTKEIKESLSDNAKKLETAMRTYMESYVKRMKTDAAKRPLTAEMLAEAKYNGALATHLRQMHDDGSELARRVEATADKDDRATLRTEVETIWKDLRVALKPLGLDVYYSMKDGKLDSLLNVYDNAYMARFASMLERLQEVRRLRKTARGDEADKLKKEQQDIEEWAASLGFRADEKTIDATLKDMRTTTDFYALDPQRAFRDHWSTVREELRLGKAPPAKAVAELNWALNALHWQSQTDEKVKPSEVAAAALNEVVAGCYSMGWLAIVEPGTTDEEYGKAMKDKTPYRLHKVTFRKLVLDDESNEAEDIVKRLDMEYEMFLKMSEDRSDLESAVRGIDGKRRADAERKALRDWLQSKEADGELKPERVLSHRMHSLVEHFERWSRPDDKDVKELLQEIDRRSKEVLGAGDAKKAAYVEAQVEAVNKKLLPYGFKLQITVGKMTVNDGGKTVEKSVSYVSLADPLPKGRVRIEMRRKIRAEEDEGKKKALETSLARYERRCEDEKVIEEFVKHAIPMVDAKTDAEDFDKKVDAFTAAKEKLQERAKGCPDNLERTMFWGRLGATARLKGYRVIRYGRAENEVITLAKPE